MTNDDASRRRQRSPARPHDPFDDFSDRQAVPAPWAEDMLSGVPLLADEPGMDLTSWLATRIRDGLIPARAVELADRAADNPTARSAVELAEALEAIGDDVRGGTGECYRVRRLADRVRVSAALLGDVYSCLYVSHKSRRFAQAEWKDGELAFRLHVGAAEFSLRSEHEPRQSRHAIRRRAEEEVRVAAAIVTGLQENGKGVVRDDMVWDPRDPDFTGDGQTWPAAGERPAAETETALGLVVLQTVGHLPGTARDGVRPVGLGGGSTPRAEYAPLAGRRLPCLPPADLPAVRARLVSRYPHAAAVIDRMLHLAVGKPYARLRPVLLVGPPGCGKTRLAREICEGLGLAVTTYSCGGVSDASFAGTSRQWSSGRASVPLQAIKRAMLATVAIVLDEVEKSAESKNNGNLQDALLSMLDHASQYHDPYLECRTDLSGVTFIATANSRRGLSEPLRDRFFVLEMPAPTREALPAIVNGILEDIRGEQGLDEGWLPGLDGEELAAVVEAHRPGAGIRALRHLVEGVIDLRASTAPRH